MRATSSTNNGTDVQCDCLSCALAYLRRGWSIVPMRLAEKRPAVKWSRYQNKLPGEKSVRRWFANGNHGIAVIFGDVSGGLASRDFDKLDAYQQWAERHPDLAQTLPTVATSRGRHVYCRATAGCVEALREHLGKQDGTGAIALPDGELRAGVGCYSVLPPSRHPSGANYKWVIELPDGPLPEVDLVRAGFLDSWPCNGEHRDNREYRDNGRLLRTTDAINTDDHQPSLHSAKCATHCAEACAWSEAIQRAIVDSLPTEPGKRYRQVFQLARALKAVPTSADANPNDLRPFAKRWHELALPVICTLPFEETWIDFLRGWPRVKFPKGAEPLADVVARAMAAAVPDAAKRYEQRPLRLLVAICRELQRTAGNDVFFLSCRTGGRLVGVDHTTANRWLFLLVADGILAEVEKGDRAKRRASRYRYVATDLPSK